MLGAVARSLGLSAAFVGLMHVWPHGRTRPRDHPTLMWQRMLSCCLIGSVAIGYIAVVAGPPSRATFAGAAPSSLASGSARHEANTLMPPHRICGGFSIRDIKAVLNASLRHPSLAAPIKATAVLFSGVVLEHALLAYAAWRAPSLHRRQKPKGGSSGGDDRMTVGAPSAAVASNRASLSRDTETEAASKAVGTSALGRTARALCYDSRAAAQWVMHEFPTVVPHWRVLFCPLIVGTGSRTRVNYDVGLVGVETARAIKAHQMLQWIRDVVIAPVSEELVFRMVIQDIEMRRIFPRNGVARVIATAAIFSVVHAHHAFELNFDESSLIPRADKPQSRVRKLLGAVLSLSIRRKPNTRPPLAYVIAPFVFGVLGGALLELGRSSAATAGITPPTTTPTAVATAHARAAVIDTVALALGLSAAHSLCNVLRQPQFGRMRPGVAAARNRAAAATREEAIDEEDLDPYVEAGRAVPPIVVNVLLPIWHVSAIIAFVYTLVKRKNAHLA